MDTLYFAIILIVTLLIFGVPVYIKNRRQQKQLEQLKKILSCSKRI